jgi:hypothetical protein
MDKRNAIKDTLLRLLQLEWGLCGHFLGGYGFLNIRALSLGLPFASVDVIETHDVGLCRLGFQSFLRRSRFTYH